MDFKEIEALMKGERRIEALLRGAGETALRQETGLYGGRFAARRAADRPVYFAGSADDEGKAERAEGADGKIAGNLKKYDNTAE